MKKLKITYAFIDSQNLNLAIRDQGWKLDFAKFRIYLREKYLVEKAFIFIGLIPSNQPLYDYLLKSGFVLIFKPTMVRNDGDIVQTKGNVDAELVLHTMIEYPNYDNTIIVTGDGDFYCLIEYLINKKKLKTILIPNRFKFSALLKRSFIKPFLLSMNDLENKLKIESSSGKVKKKRPHKDKTLQGYSSVRDTRILAKRRKYVK